MAALRASLSLSLMVASFLVAGCSATRQHTDLTLQGDLPTRDVQGRTAATRRRAVQASQERRVTVMLPCASEDVESLDACRARVQRMKLTPIASQLGKPPRPAEVARKTAPSGLDQPADRERARAAYADAVRERYRSYATYVAAQLAGADWVEIPDADGVVQRYRGDRITGGLDETLVGMGERYAALEWNQFLRERPREPAAQATGGRARTASRSTPVESAGHAGRAARSEVGAAPAPEAPVPDAERAVPAPEAPVPAAERAPPEAAPPAPAPAAPMVSAATPSPAAPCRRACGLNGRVCVAGCRDRPVSGSDYDACMRACDDAAAACRGRCAAP